MDDTKAVNVWLYLFPKVLKIYPMMYFYYDIPATFNIPHGGTGNNVVLNNFHLCLDMRAFKNMGTKSNKSKLMFFKKM